MNLSRRARSRLLLLASMSAPVLGAQAMRLIGSGGPAVSSAVVTAGAATPGPVTAPARELPPTPEQTRALQWLRLRNIGASIRCPMGQLAASQQPKAKTDTVPVPEPVQPVGPDPLKVLVLTAIMTGEEGGLATINGKVYVVGAIPLAGWTVTLIDPDNRLVRISNAGGEVVELHLKQTGSNR